MSTTDGTTGFLFKEQSDTIGAIYTYVNDVVNPINDWAKLRMDVSYRWTNAAARTAQSGMTTGQKGYQVDTDTTYRYNGSAWKLWDKPWGSYTPTVSNFASATVAPTTTGRYNISSGTVTVITNSKLGTGTITVGNITVSTPVAIETTGLLTETTVLGKSSFTDVSAGPLYFYGDARYVDANTIRAYRVAQTAAYASGDQGRLQVSASGNPFTWATLDEMSTQFIYPAA